MPKESTRLSSVAPIQDPAMKLNKEPEQTVDSKAAILQRLDQKLPAFGFLLAVFSCFFCVTTTLMVKLTPNLNTTVMLTIRLVLILLIFELKSIKSLHLKNKWFFSDVFFKRSFTLFPFCIKVKLF